MLLRRLAAFASGAVVATAAVHAVGASQAVAATPTADAILQQTHAAYASLKTYADTGSVDLEFGPGGGIVREHHAFRTAYRAPRQFRFDFTKAGNADRYVVWGDGETFHSYWKSTGTVSDYPKGRGANAFIFGSAPTSAAILQLAPMLFPGAGLSGTMTEFGSAALAGTETIAGHPCYKLTGKAQAVYGATGHVTDVRPTTLWIDSQTSMVRRIFEDRTQGVFVNRTTTTFDPRPDAPVDEALFRFTPPGR